MKLIMAKLHINISMHVKWCLSSRILLLQILKVLSLGYMDLTFEEVVRV
jgi:hypothetical protein